MDHIDAISGADALVAALEEAGIEVCFGLPGVHNLAIWSALARSPIRLVGVRHEQTAAYAADGYARATGRVGVALTTTGPGAANTLAAVGEAFASGSPTVVVATDIPTGMRRPGVLRGVLHETRDQAAMFAPVVKQTMVVSRREEIAAVVTAAVDVASRAPSGPVYVEVPTDLLHAVGPSAGSTRLPPEVAGDVDTAALAEAIDLVRRAERPLLWLGGGTVQAGAGPQAAVLAQKLGAPVLETYGGRGVVGARHPLAVGLPPHVPEAGELWDQADVVVAVGTEFDGMMTQNWRMPAPPRLIAVNVDAQAAAKAYPPTVTLVGDAAAILERLLPELGDPTPPWAGDLAARRVRTLDRLAEEDEVSARFLRSLAAAVPSDATVVCDMCIPGYWIGGFHPVERPRALAYPVGWGTLGFGFPASLGAALAGAGPTLCVCGDGGFMFACGELATAVQERIPVCVLLVDDGGYGMLRYDQVQAQEALGGTELLTPDWSALARAFGLEAERIDDPGEPLVEALRRRLGAPEPSLIVLDAAMLPPPTTSPRWYRKTTNTQEVMA